MRQFFRYDDVTSTNPRKLPQAFKCCKLATGGLCGKDKLAASAKTGAFNLYAKLRSFKKMYPLLIRAHQPGAEQYSVFAFLGRIMGDGDQALLVMADKVGEVADEPQVRVFHDRDTDNVVGLTFAMLVDHVNLAAARFLLVARDSFDTLIVNAFSYI